MIYLKDQTLAIISVVVVVVVVVVVINNTLPDGDATGAPV